MPHSIDAFPPEFGLVDYYEMGVPPPLSAQRTQGNSVVRPSRRSGLRQPSYSSTHVSPRFRPYTSKAPPPSPPSRPLSPERPMNGVDSLQIVCPLRSLCSIHVFTNYAAPMRALQEKNLPCRSHVAHDLARSRDRVRVCVQDM